MTAKCWLARPRALGNLNYANASGLNPVSLAESLAGLAVEACGRGTTSVSSEDEGEFPIVRRRLRTEINTVILGLNGVDERHKGIRGLAQDSPNKDHVERLQQRVQNMALAFDKKDPKDAKKEIDDSELAGRARRRGDRHHPTDRAENQRRCASRRRGEAGGRHVEADIHGRNSQTADGDSEKAGDKGLLGHSSCAGHH